ncbi:MAG TPA: hypothetical protein VNL98_05790 [Gemmatimonadales bacterium]|nr:hypothetical protein [Gemmatimonadales bacterium]
MSHSASTTARLTTVSRAIERFVPARRRGLSFGIPALDSLLPHGVPRGQITVLDAPLGSGGTALLLTLAETTLRADEAVALVDARRNLAPQAAAHLAECGLFWVIRPRGTESAWWCTDVLLRTGAFGLVIVDQPESTQRRVLVRLQRLAADKDAALVVREAARRYCGMAVSESDVPTADRARHPLTALPPYRLTAHLRLHVSPDASGFLAAAPGSGAAWPGPRTVRVTIEKGGAPRAAEVKVGTNLPYRLRPHWEVRDRRARLAPRGSLGGRGQRRRAAQPDWPEQR